MKTRVYSQVWLLQVQVAATLLKRCTNDDYYQILCRQSSKGFKITIYRLQMNKTMYLKSRKTAVKKAGFKEQSDDAAGLVARLNSSYERFVLTSRDAEIVSWVYFSRLANREQLHSLFFTVGGRSRCVRRLTLLRLNRYLDVLPGRASNSQALYHISRRCTNGLRLLRTMHPETDIKPHKPHASTTEHILDVASCRIAFTKACVATGYSMRFWLDTSALSRYIQTTGILPDAYFQICRTTEDGEKLSGFFVEVERSGKSAQALEKKFKLYGQLYYQGLYEAQFGTKALRILFLVGPDYGINPQRQIEKLVRICKKLNVTIFRFAPLKNFLALDPTSTLVAEIWRQPSEDRLSGLF